MIVPGSEIVGLAELVALRAAECPDLVAIEELDGERRRRSWSELRSESERWAGALTQVGVGAGMPVLTMLPNALESAVVWTAMAHLGALEVAINDAYRGAWLEHTADVARASIAVIHADFLGQWLPSLHRTSVSTVLVVGSTGQLPSSGDVAFIDAERMLAVDVPIPQRVPSPVAQPALVMFTSGTTGKSKGVVTSWGYWRHRARTGNTIPPDFLGPSDIIYSPLPIFHLSGRECFYRVASVGASLRTRRRVSVSQWLPDVVSSGATYANLIGSLALFLMQQPRLASDADNSLRAVCNGPIAPDVEEFAARFGIEVFTAYGMTECNNPLSSWRYKLDSTNYQTCGECDPEREVRIVDEDGADVAEGEVGELWVRDDRADHKMAIGYLNNPEATSKTWRDGWMRTGDAFRRDTEGRYYFIDRLKDAIRRRGENISSFEVESVICSHPAVAEAAVFAVPSESMEDEVMAAIVPVRGIDLDLNELRHYLTNRMPKFALPRFIDIVDALPKTATAKTQKAELRNQGLSASTWDFESQDPTTKGPNRHV